jgi:hypothetical protein
MKFNSTSTHLAKIGAGKNIPSTYVPEQANLSLETGEDFGYMKK